MLLLGSFLLTVSVALSAPADGMGGMMGATSMPDNPPKQMCCLPAKWQANMIEMKNSKGLTSTMVFAYDEINKLEGFYIVPMGTDKPVYQQFTDYNTMMVYSVDMSGSDKSAYKCKQEKSTTPFYGGCSTNNTIKPTNMVYVGESTIGPTTNVIKFDIWSYSLNTMDIVIALTRDSCIPILENVKSDSPVPYEMLYMFNSVSGTVTNPELLTLPGPCVGSSVIG